MRRVYKHSAVLCLLLLLTGCFNNKKINWKVTLDSGDKKPYGSYLAFQSLKYYFPGAKIETLSPGFRYSGIDGTMKQGEQGKALMILLGLDFYVSETEMKALIDFAGEGNELIIFCSKLDAKIENSLHCYKQVGGAEEMKLTPGNNGKQNIQAINLKQQPGRFYGHEGRSLQGYFGLKNWDINTDSAEAVVATAPDTLGTMMGKPNFIRYAIGNGHISLHAAPLVMSNYFLLQGGNRYYLDGLWQTLPTGISRVYWNEYYKHSAQGANLSILWKYPATRWALIIAIITLLLYVLFESRRRQRLIPLIEKPANSSVSFVETVGRLYYNKGDHNNLADKIIQHFLEWVRLHYYLNTHELNEHFVKQLSGKSGIDETEVRDLVDKIHNIRLRNISVDEALLTSLYMQIQQFYKKHKSYNGYERQPASSY